LTVEIPDALTPKHGLVCELYEQQEENNFVHNAADATDRTLFFQGNL
jgi:hypothetical protein